MLILPNSLSSSFPNEYTLFFISPYCYQGQSLLFQKENLIAKLLPLCFGLTAPLSKGLFTPLQRPPFLPVLTHGSNFLLLTALSDSPNVQVQLSLTLAGGCYSTISTQDPLQVSDQPDPLNSQLMGCIDTPGNLFQAFCIFFQCLPLAENGNSHICVISKGGGREGWDVFVFVFAQAKFNSFVTACFKLKMSVSLALWQAEGQGQMLLLRNILKINDAKGQLPLTPSLTLPARYVWA